MTKKKERKIRKDYNVNKAKMIYDLKEAGYSYNKIAKALNYEISPARVAHIYKNFIRKILPRVEKRLKQMKVVDNGSSV